MFQASEIILSILILAAGWLAWYIARVRYYFTLGQIQELTCYVVIGTAALLASSYFLLTGHTRREKRRPPPPLSISHVKHETVMRAAWEHKAVVLGYDVHGQPVLWSDELRVMHGLVTGMTGSGKTTLLQSIIVQDLYRTVGTPDRPRRVPMIIFGGKGDMDDCYSLLPHVHRAGRLHQFRLLNPSEPDLSIAINPFNCSDQDYMPVVNSVFGSFNLRDEFFAKHQLNYLGDIVRVLIYTGFRFNIYDILVMGLDEQVLREQVQRVSRRLEEITGVSTQQKLNFEMSVRRLLESLADRERIAKIQGLLNELMTFLDDELSVVTGPYEDLLSLDDVIDQDLILYVTLNVNKNTEPVRALGKILLQSLQRMIGKSYESSAEERRATQPFFSVVLDEFAPFAYRKFAQIAQTARGTNTALLFSVQSLPQLMQVGRGFKEDVSSAPNTTLTLRTRDEDTVRYFLQASAEHRVTKRNRSVERWKLFGYEMYEDTGRATDIETTETRALDEHIKNLPTGHLEGLITHHRLGTEHKRVNICPPANVEWPNFKPELYEQLLRPRGQSAGLNLRFKSTTPTGRSRAYRRTTGDFRA